MKQILSLLFLLSSLCLSAQKKPCNLIALDTLDEFDTTRLIASKPMKWGFLVPTEALAANLEGNTYTDEAKAIFSYADENKTRSFFLTIAVVEREFHMIENDFTVFLKFTDDALVKLFNVPAKPEFNRDILMWEYVHTCVVPFDIFHMLKNVPLEKVRINYKNYKATIVLEEKQQEDLLQAVRCVEERLNSKGAKP
jgi:hypothetical protein